MKKSIDKLLLYNHMRHANAHNKVKEEQEMWKARESELAADRNADMRKHSPIVRGRLVSDAMDSPDQSSSPSSTYWSRQLMKEEESDPCRWGHGGYKELYPEEFASTGGDDTSDSSPSDTSVHRKKRKRKRSPPPSPSRKSKKHKKHKHSSNAIHKSKHKPKRKSKKERK
ncbi:uncharacterized protein NKAPD1-like [Dysidea avara]|uniref:uncharacterized protein NKAPD1-like n=1 Tax=Dysidea avara TaxID=196820 RepID=UPI0033341880